MKKDQDRLEYLFKQYLQKSCTREELDEFIRFHTDPLYTERLKELYEYANEISPLTAIDIDWEHMYSRITSNAVKTPSRFTFLRRNWLRYAALVLMITMVYFLYTNSSKKLSIQKHLAGSAIDIAPATNNAILTLADGNIIALDKVSEGEVASQGNVKVIKLNSGELVYKTDPQLARGTEILNNKISTPRGGNYQVILPDGTKVWLNAASSISYPSAFTEKFRKVVVTGEVYMEVAKDAIRPFKVIAGNMEVDVLGTGFNINCYTDEPTVNTTLIEGSIKTSIAGNSNTLLPGWQAIINKGENTPRISVRKADVEQTIAWKNGLFLFSGADLPTVLRELSRWYDVDIVYAGKIPERKFGGKIQRDLNLSQVLGILKKMEVNFSIEEGKKLIVNP